MLSKIEKAISSVGLTVGGFVIVFGSITAIRLISEINTIRAESAQIEQVCQANIEAHKATRLAEAATTTPATAPATAVLNAGEVPANEGATSAAQ